MTRILEGRGKGYSLLEAILVVVLIAAIAVVSLPTLFRTLQSYQIQMAAQQIATNVRFARALAIKQKVTFRVIFNASTDQYEIWWEEGNHNLIGTQYKHVDTSLPKNIDISSVALFGGATQIDFSATGTPSTNGIITLKGKDLSEWQITVTQVGGVTLVRTQDGV